MPYDPYDADACRDSRHMGNDEYRRRREVEDAE